MSRSRAFTRHQRRRSIERVRRNTAHWMHPPAEMSVKRMAQCRGVCSCGLCKPWKRAGNGKARWDGVRQMQRASYESD